MHAYHYIYIYICVTLIVADSQEHADRIASAVVVTYNSLGPPILTLEEAIEAKSFFKNARRVETKVGDVEGSYKYNIILRTQS